jgi:filamentous hemagglutinin
VAARRRPGRPRPHLSGALLNGQDGLIYSKPARSTSAPPPRQHRRHPAGPLDGTLRIQGAAANQGGRITSQAGNLDVQAASLDNGSGGILSSAAGWLKLVTGWFGNNGGVTQAQSLDVRYRRHRQPQRPPLGGQRRQPDRHHQPRQRHGGLYAGGLLSVSGNQLLSQSGKVGASSLDFGLAAP